MPAVFLADRLGNPVLCMDRTAFFAFSAFVLIIFEPLFAAWRYFMKKVAIIMGSDSDLPVVKPAADTLKEFGVPFTVRVLSAHRTPEELRAFVSTAAENGYGVIIAAAGKAAHLAGSVAANTVLPVIGIPVATVAIDGAKNAALLALQILGVSDPEISAKLALQRANASAAVLRKDAEISASFAE